MELEKQVCSLELAKKLKELGVPQDSQFYWYGSEKRVGFERGTKTEYEKDVHKLSHKQLQLRDYPSHERTLDDYSAYTGAELGELLPPSLNVKSRKDMQWLTWQNNRYTHTIAYVGTKVDNPALAEHAGTESNARAKMLIYLIENKLFTPT